MTEKNNPQTNNDQQQDFTEAVSSDLEDIFKDYFQDEFIISVLLDNIHTLCEFSKNKLLLLNESISRFLEHQENQANSSENYIRIVAQCQKQTAEIANATLERHALNPAIETVFMLTNMFQQLYEQSVTLTENQSYCSLFKSILSSIADFAKIASTKCDYLGITKISPKTLGDFDPHKHEIKQTIITDDSSKHKKIKHTLIPGLIYRGKVLQQAKVSVYRYSENSKGQENERNS